MASFFTFTCLGRSPVAHRGTAQLCPLLLALWVVALCPWGHPACPCPAPEPSQLPSLLESVLKSSSSCPGSPWLPRYKVLNNYSRFLSVFISSLSFLSRKGFSSPGSCRTAIPAPHTCPSSCTWPQPGLQPANACQGSSLQPPAALPAPGCQGRAHLGPRAHLRDTLSSPGTLSSPERQPELTWHPDLPLPPISPHPKPPSPLTHLPCGALPPAGCVASAAGF